MNTLTGKMITPRLHLALRLRSSMQIFRATRVPTRAARPARAMEPPSPNSSVRMNETSPYMEIVATTSSQKKMPRK